jgi:carboxypeptidase T
MPNGQKGRCKMKWLQRIYLSIVFVHIISGALAMASHTKPPSDKCILINVFVADRNDAEALVNMGLDIWEYRECGLIIRVTDDERKQIKEYGFAIETITEDVYEYLETKREAQLSLFKGRTTAKYHSHDEVIAALLALEDSGVAQTYIIGNTHECRDIWAVRISDNPAEDEDEPSALFMGCQHAREWIAIEVPLYIAQYLVDNYDNDAEVKHLVDNCEIWIVPVVNPDGYEYSRTVDQMWRKNRRDNGDGTYGVDLNRNWGYMWGLDSGSSPQKSNETYRGPSAFSEPETQAVRDLILAYDFQIMLDYHSYGQQTYHPWGYTQESCSDYFPMGAITYKMRELIKQTNGAEYRDWWDSGGYLVSGDSTDWCYGELGIYSFGTELGGSFIPAENLIIPICEENLPAALYLISLSAAKGGIENSRTGETYSSIQFAINDALNGDEIVISEGTYHENILFRGYNITLRSTDPNDPAVVAATVIDGDADRAMRLYEGHDTRCEFNGLKITSRTIVLSCYDAAPTIRNCTIEGTGRSVIEFYVGHEPSIIDCNIPGVIREIVNPETDNTVPRIQPLIAYWKLDETDGMNAEDSVSNIRADLFGDPVWWPTDGMVNGALMLDGINDFVGTGSIPNLSTGQMSVFAWVKGGVPGQVVVSEYKGVNWLMADVSQGYLKTDLKEAGDTAQSLVSEITITDGQWHHVGLIWDGTKRVLYADDVAVASDTQTEFEYSAMGLNLGCGPNETPGTFFSGLIDDVRIYNRAITP